MNLTNYSRGRSYCYKLNSSLYRDILHDAYLHWFNKTGRDLFDEPMSRVIRVIKLTWLGYYVNQRVRSREFLEYDDHLVTEITPEDQLMAKELDDYMIANSSKLHLEVYLLAVQGYLAIEIAEKLGLSKACVSNYFKKLRWTASLFN